MTRRFYLDLELKKGLYTLTDDEYRHARVLRLQTGDNVSLVNGKGALGKAIVKEITKNTLTVEVQEVLHEEQALYISTLAAAIIKQSRLETLIEKSVEIGINRLFFYRGERSEKTKLSLPRAEKIAISALKQSGRLTLPDIQVFPSMQEIPHEHCLLYYGSPRSSSQNPPHPKRNAIFYVGPEKGFSHDEEIFLEKIGASPTLLALTTLRAETAGILASAFLEYYKTTCTY